ncbi:DNA internalization-related competence protein ComEC/Rec2 [Sporosarcina siberiensis]|uniref:DNA internalization-related competence protein ComEC/Rec2 n=1 Tax=Sporosarcina siberiensis TaxID=1365606 RepID=A0ABW4SD20_9BACL
MFSRIRFIYVAITVAVSAFSVYGSAYLLLVNILLIPIFFRRKGDYLTPILTFIAALLSFTYFTSSLPKAIELGPATITMSWFDNAKIDGGKVKGLAKTSAGQTLYAVYKFNDEQEKNSFSELHLPSVTFTLTGVFREADMPSHIYAFNMENYMRMYGSSGIFESEVILNAVPKSNVYTRLSLQRQKVKLHINSTFPKQLIPEAEALLIGDRSGMDETDATVYKRLGITHLFAISGLHVGLLAFMFRELLLRLSFRKGTVDMLLIVMLPLYAVLAGGAPSVWRAVSVTTFVLLASLIGLKIRLDNALAISALVFISIQPYILFQPGFQLSYLAAFSLILSSKILVKAKTAIGISFLVTSISQLSLYPVLLFHFYEISLSSFFVNLIYVPLYSLIILPVNIILLIVTWLSTSLSTFLFMIYAPFRECITWISIWLSSLPYQLWTPGKLSAIEMVCIIAGVLYFFVQCEEGVKARDFLIFVILPALTIHVMPYLDGTLKVTFLDVGQGDSAVVELPYRKAVYLIDTGGTVFFGENGWKTPGKSFEVGRKVVVTYLKGRGIKKIDKLIISHAHLDHMGGADEVLEEITVNEIHITSGSEDEKEMVDLLRVAKMKKVPIHSVKDGLGWSEGQISFNYMSPQDERYLGNDSSLVLLMKTPGLSFLFTGDLETEGERKFVKKYGSLNYGRILLKGGHHGSRTSSTEPFIKALRPELTIFSVGRNNTYRHPHEDVLERFIDLGYSTMSTAVYGTITIDVVKEDYSVTVMQK